MHPHDYYAPYSDEPHLHNRHAGRHYVEPDWQANAAGHQLPVLSTVGRGPRGEGLQVSNIVEEDGIESFALYSTLTGELLWQSPNLAPGDLSFTALPFDQLSAGQPAPLDIKWTRGGTTKTTHAYLPCGEPGSLIFTLADKIQKNTTDIYQTTMGDLVVYKRETWPNHQKPNAKVNDIVMCCVVDEDGEYLAVGDIINVGDHGNEEITASTAVQFIIRCYVVAPTARIGTSYKVVAKQDPNNPNKWTLDKKAKELTAAAAAGRILYLDDADGRFFSERMSIVYDESPSPGWVYGAFDGYFQFGKRIENNTVIPAEPEDYPVCKPGTQHHLPF